jgi:hypothetical protein
MPALLAAGADIDSRYLRSVKLRRFGMALLRSRSPILHACDRNGPRDVKLKMGLSPRETADTTRRVSAPPANECDGEVLITKQLTGWDPDADLAIPLVERENGEDL